MDFQWVAIALGDVVWILLAFTLGLLARSVGLPPMVGFLATGFLLNAQGIVSGEMLQKLSDLGVTLLLFTVGLKLNLRTFARPQVWAVTVIHSSIVVLVFGFAIYGLAAGNVPFFADLDLPRALLVAFALSFSSTVFVVKILEERSGMTSLHGRIAIGILIMQDLAAVIFLAASSGDLPSPWAILVLLLLPLRPLLHALLQRVGHGELQVLYGFILALGGAELFELVGLKGDLGALVLGVLIASHSKAEEMAKTMLGFKDLFLLGFFLSIGPIRSTDRGERGYRRTARTIRTSQVGAILRLADAIQAARSYGPACIAEPVELQRIRSHCRRDRRRQRLDPRGLVDRHCHCTVHVVRHRCRSQCHFEFDLHTTSPHVATLANG